MAQTDRPNVLYRYRSCQTAYFIDELERLVAEKTAFFVPISVHNDPFDCNPYFVESDLPEIRKILKRLNKKYLVSMEYIKQQHSSFNRGQLKRKQKEFRIDYRGLSRLKILIGQLVQKMRDESNIICLSETWDNLLMWSHYASGLDGVSIEYEVRWDLLPVMNAEPPYPVMYDNHRKQVSTVDLLVFLLSSSDTGFPQDLLEKAEAAADSLIGLKAADWSYEREWRVQMRGLGKSGYQHVPILEPRSVIVGARVSDANCERIREICRPRLSVSYVKLSDEKFSLLRGVER